MARFHLEKHAMPSASLRRFMAARCGATASEVSPVVWWATAPRAVSEGQLIAKAEESVGRLLDEQLAKGHSVFGAGVARDDSHVSLVIVVGRDLARFEPGSRSVDESRHVTLRGSTRGDYARLTALINQGQVGTERCVGEPEVVPPQFAFSCTLAPGDKFAWVQLLGHHKGRALAEEVSETLVYEGDGSSVAYTARRLDPPASPSQQEVATGLVERLNGVRQRAGMAPLVLAPEQSRENVRLAGTVIDPAAVDDGKSADLAALGLVAGWKVHGLVRGGEFFVGAVGGTRDVSAWLDFALERPIGRLALLDPQARQIAVGPALPQGIEAIGAVVTTYELFESADHGADETRFMERIDAARAAKGVPKPVFVRATDAARAECARVRDGDREPMAALRTIMDDVSVRTGRPVSGYVLETNDLTHVEIPTPLLGPGPLEAMVAITHHRADGAAWGQYVVFVALPGGSAEGVGQVAAVGAAPPRL
jgi:hypothetical protein